MDKEWIFGLVAGLIFGTLYYIDPIMGLAYAMFRIIWALESIKSELS